MHCATACPGRDGRAGPSRAGRSTSGLTRAMTRGVPSRCREDDPLAANQRPFPAAGTPSGQRCRHPGRGQVRISAPLGGMDSMAVRRWPRDERGRAGRAAGTGCPPSSRDQMALRHPEGGRCATAEVDRPAGCRPDLARRRGIRPGTPPRSRSGGGCSRDEGRTVAAGGRPPGECGRRANRDLDAIGALFDIAARARRSPGHAA